MLSRKEKASVIVDKLAKYILLVAIEDNKFISNNFAFKQVGALTRQEKVTGPLQSTPKRHWCTVEAVNSFI